MDRTITIEGPAYEAKLSALDAKCVSLYSRRLLIFKPAVLDKERIAKVFEQGLARLVQQVPILGGIVNEEQSPHRKQKGWKAIEKGPGLELVIKDVSNELDFDHLDKETFPPTSLADKLLVPVPVDFPKTPYPACKMQLNLADGGVVLAVCIVHNVSDGPGMTTIIQLLAEHCRQVQEESSNQSPFAVAPELQLGLDRNPYINLKGSRNKMEDHPAYRLRGRRSTTAVGSKNEAPPVVDCPKPDPVMKMYRLNGETLKALKTAATTVRISTHDALSAVIWRATIINRIAAGLFEHDRSADTRFLPPVSTHRHMGLSNFIGNAIYQTCCSMKVGDLLSDDGLPQAAARIRGAINGVTRDYIDGHIELLESLPDLRDFQWIGAADPLLIDVACTSFYHSESIYESDWGAAFGNHVYRMRPSATGFGGAISGLVYVMPNEGERGCEVQMCVERRGLAEMENDPVFARYFLAK